MAAVMGSNFQLFMSFLLWGGVGLGSPWAVWGRSASRTLLGTHPVEVRCHEAQLAVTVQRDLFGTGKLIRPQDITLGPSLCRPVLALEEEIRFEVGLHECGNRLQVRLASPKQGFFFWGGGLGDVGVVQGGAPIL